MRDVLAKMRECGKDVKMRDFPHDCGMVDTYDIYECIKVIRPSFVSAKCTLNIVLRYPPTFDMFVTRHYSKRKHHKM